MTRSAGARLPAAASVVPVPAPAPSRSGRKNGVIDSAHATAAGGAQDPGRPHSQQERRDPREGGQNRDLDPEARRELDRPRFERQERHERAEGQQKAQRGEGVTGGTHDG